MANTNFAQGLLPHRHLNGSPWNGQLQRMAILASDATALFKGDLVKSAGTADVNGVQAITRATADTENMVGVIVGFDVDYSNLNSPNQMRLASTARYALVCVDPSVVYEIQSNGTCAVADIGLNCGLVYTAGSTTSGLSKMVAAQSTVNTTVTLPLKILGWIQRGDVDVTDGTNMKLEVLVNTTTTAVPTVGN